MKNNQQAVYIIQSAASQNKAQSI